MMSKEKKKGFIGYIVVNDEGWEGKFGVPMAIGYNSITVLAQVWIRLLYHVGIEAFNSDIEMDVQEREFTDEDIELFENMYKNHTRGYLKTMRFQEGD